jgi:hypothetical protein
VFDHNRTLQITDELRSGKWVERRLAICHPDHKVNPGPPPRLSGLPPGGVGRSCCAWQPPHLELHWHHEPTSGSTSPAVTSVPHALAAGTNQGHVSSLAAWPAVREMLWGGAATAARMYAAPPACALLRKLAVHSMTLFTSAEKMCANRLTQTVRLCLLQADFVSIIADCLPSAGAGVLSSHVLPHRTAPGCMSNLHQARARAAVLRALAKGLISVEGDPLAMAVERRALLTALLEECCEHPRLFDAAGVLVVRSAMF